MGSMCPGQRGCFGDFDLSLLVWDLPLRHHHFTVSQMQEKFRAKGRKLYFGFMDLEKAFDRVPREVI